MCALKVGGSLSLRTGRPPSDNPKNERLYIRVTPGEKVKIQQFCKDFGVSLLDLIRKGMEALKK